MVAANSEKIVPAQRRKRSRRSLLAKARRCGRRDYNDGRYKGHRIKALCGSDVFDAYEAGYDKARVQTAWTLPRQLGRLLGRPILMGAVTRLDEYRAKRRVPTEGWCVHVEAHALRGVSLAASGDRSGPLAGVSLKPFGDGSGAVIFSATDGHILFEYSCIDEAKPHRFAPRCGRGSATVDRPFRRRSGAHLATVARCRSGPRRIPARGKGPPRRRAAVPGPALLWSAHVGDIDPLFGIPSGVSVVVDDMARICRASALVGGGDSGRVQFAFGGLGGTIVFCCHSSGAFRGALFWRGMGTFATAAATRRRPVTETPAVAARIILPDWYNNPVPTDAEVDAIAAERDAALASYQDASSAYRADHPPPPTRWDNWPEAKAWEIGL